MSSSKTPESPPVAFTQFLHRRRWPSPLEHGFGTLKKANFEANGSLALRPAELLASFRDLYVRASDESVTLLAAGYNYGVNWAISTGGTLIHWNGS